MKCFVIGGSGFVGKALANKLKDLGHEVSFISRRKVPELEQRGIKGFYYDISDSAQDFTLLFKDIDCIFHTAAKVSMWGKYQDFYNTNVVGTNNLLEAAKKAGVKYFVYTSSPSVIADGTNLKGIDESYPYPAKYKAFYPMTKAMAERAVLAANSDNFFTLSLRPHLIFGPGDTNLTPTIISRAKAGKLKIIGDGKNTVDFTHIDDCVQAHVKAMEALANNPNSRGRPYFITQGKPTLMWEWINKLLVTNGVAPVTKKIPYKTAYFAATLAEFFGRLFSLKDLKLTRFLVSEMATDHYFSIEAAKKELGYNIV